MLQLKDICKDYKVDKKPFPALIDVNISFEKTGFVSILGPSGCGKTTLLNIIGGLDHYTSGDLLINGKSTKKFKDKDWDAYRNKRVGFVFQNYNLIPHLSLLENVQISLTLSGVSPKERKQRSLDLLEKVGLKEEANKKPSQLSGGQMQRVAIARALVNNPEIILADEPTGALDTKTSIQIMEILKEIAQTKLVIMVTHNQELAKQYSTRIINLLDGRVAGDSAPVVLNEFNGEEKLKSTHMNIFTSLYMSGKNLLTKKGRTALTAIASSFGIIGVALVLAVQNGFSNYIGRVEASTASSLPITIAPYTTKSIIERYNEHDEYYPDDKNIRVYQTPTVEQLIVHRNYFTEEYINYLDGIKDDGDIASILYNRDGLDFNIVTQYCDQTNIGWKVNQYSSSNSTSDLISGVTGLPTSVFYELYGDKNYITSMYDVLDGKYPENKNEVVLVTNRLNQVDLRTLVRLGVIKDDDNIPEKISFEDIYKKTFRAYTSDAFYGDPVSVTNTPAYQLDIDKFKVMVIAAQALSKITGEPVDYAAIIKECKQATSKTITAYNNYDYDYYNRLHELVTTDAYTEGTDYVELKIVGVLRPRQDSLITLLPTSIGYTKELKDFFAEKSANSQVAAACKNNWYIPQTDEAWNNFADVVSLLQDGTQSTSMTEQDINTYVNGIYKFKNIYGSEVTISAYLTHCKKMGVDLPVDRNIINGDFDDYDIQNANDLLIEIRDNFINYLAYYLGYSRITSIIIFPSSLDAKASIIKKLEAYNKNKKESEQIIYTDLIGDLVDNIATMINIVSIVLVVFASISLVVSCVMTGIITYISVIERTKEIGVLRAVGARKTDVGRLFEAESMIVGFVSGVIGVIASILISIPVNLILNHQFPDAAIGNIANLHPLHGVLLVVISVTLTFISGLIPARVAAKKDPVVALRTE